MTSMASVDALPFDILATELFPRLPAKSLLRFKCVCRSWLALISSPEFTNLHLRQSLSDKTNRLLVLHLRYKKGDRLALVELDLLETHAAEIPLHHDSFVTPTYVGYINIIESCHQIKKNIIGSCNGLLCLRIRPRGSDILVLNPTTKIFRKVSLHQKGFETEGLGFGYDRDSDDYKIVHIVIICELQVRYKKVMVFSLRGNCWRDVGHTPLHDRDYLRIGAALIDNHLLHWIIKRFDNDSWEGQFRISCFDISSERWVNDVPLPNEHSLNSTGIRIVDFRAVDRCLCIKAEGGRQWLMKEYGVKESWVQLWDNSVRNNSRLRCPIVHNKFSDCKFLVRGGSRRKLVWYNTSSKTLEGIGKFSFSPALLSDAYFCVGSLVGIPGGERIDQAAEHLAIQ